jgi:hypothetical protein
MAASTTTDTVAQSPPTSSPDDHREYDISITECDTAIAASSSSKPDHEKPPTSDADQSVATLRVLDRATLREWSAPFDSCMRELGDAVNSKHALFTRANALAVIKSLIARHQVKITRNAGTCGANDTLDVVFALSVKSELLPEIIDELAFTLTRVAQTDGEIVVKRLVRRAEDQDREIARLAHIVANFDALSRTVRINELIADTAAKYRSKQMGKYFALARRVFAAEVDGSPIVFKALGCGHPIWLRSVIRYVNACDPYDEVYKRVSTSGETSSYHTKHRGGNDVGGSQPIGFGDWIDIMSERCRADVLVIAPFMFTDEKPKKESDESRVSYFESTRQHADAQCNAKVVIFADPFSENTLSFPQNKTERAVHRQMLSFYANAPRIYRKWLEKCERVSVAKIGDKRDMSFGTAIIPAGASATCSERRKKSSGASTSEQSEHKDKGKEPTDTSSSMTVSGQPNHEDEQFTVQMFRGISPIGIHEISESIARAWNSAVDHWYDDDVPCDKYEGDGVTQYQTHIIGISGNLHA